MTPPGSAASAPLAALSGVPDFIRLTGGQTVEPTDGIPSLRRIVAQVAAIGILLVLLVTVGAAYASSKFAEQESINDAANTANLLAQSVVQPVLSDALLTSDPGAVAALDKVVRQSVLPNNIVRVKVWRPDGTVVYADDPRLIGRTFQLDAEQMETLASPQTRAEVSDLSSVENEFERFDSPLLEVYRPVWTPSGKQLMFEVYGRYDPVLQRAADLRKGLTGLLISTVLLLVTLMAPLVWRLVARLRAASLQRVELMQRAVDASDEERRRIAVNLHDGPVQELVASAYAVAGAAERAAASDHPEVVDTIRDAEAAVRTTVGSLRSLLVDLYPASLASAGLVQAVSDLAAPLRSRGLTVETEVAEEAAAALDAADQRLVYRTVRECLRNVIAHAEATWVQVTLRRVDTAVHLDIVDDGVGFDAAVVMAGAEPGHLGLRSLVDTASARGAELLIASAHDSGTHWRLAIPTLGRTTP